MDRCLRPSTQDDLRIGIDGRCLSRKGPRAGIIRYVTELCRALDKQLPNAHFYVYSLDEPLMPRPSPRWIIRTEPCAALKKLFQVSATTLPWFRYCVGALCKADRINIFWGTQSILPRLPSRVRSLVTIYDLNMLLVPETMHWRSAVANRLFLKSSLREAKWICAISSGTARKLQDLVAREANAVISPGVSAAFSPRNPAEISACLRRYGIRRSYLMALSTWEPRKNLATLVQAFVRLRSEGCLPNHDLVLVGGRGWRDARLSAMVRDVSEQGVRPLGYVPDEDLPALYTGCEAFVFPSIYEGFGIPVLEARACGARVIATDIPELREAGGDDTIYVSPSLEGLCSGIKRALTRDIRRNATHTIAQTWEESAAKFASVLDQ